MVEQADTAFKTTGCQWLLPVSELLGFPLDQVRSPTATVEIPVWIHEYRSEVLMNEPTIKECGVMSVSQ